MTTRVDRRTFGFALKDELPLPSGRHKSEFHDDLCEHAEGSLQGPCHAIRIEIVQIPSEGTIGKAIQGISIAAHPHLPGELPEDKPLNLERNASYILASVVVDHENEDPIGDAYRQVMELIRRRVDSIRVAMGANLPPMSFERFYPVYEIFLEDADGNLVPNNIVFDEERMDEFAVRHATKTEIARADHYLVAGSADDPVELIADLNQRCRTLLRSGDYLSATVVAATASEVLIKTLSCALVWEAKTYGSQDPGWVIGRSKLLNANLATLLTDVLPGALGDVWHDQVQSDPLWQWRNALYKTRNRIVHEGHRPTDVEARLAVEAYEGLNNHVIDRLASRAQHFPRCALMLAGKSVLQDRGAWGKVRATAEAAETNHTNFSREYLQWIG